MSANEQRVPGMKGLSSIGRALRLAPRALVVLVLLTACRGSTSPPPASTTGEAFDAVWKAFDATYPYFTLKGVNWTSVRSQYQARAAAARDVTELNALLVEMLGSLKDLHVSLEGPSAQRISTFTPPWPRNFDAALWQRTIAGTGWVQVKTNLGRTRIDGVPYIAIGSWNSNQFETADLDQTLESFRQDSVMIIDVRPNGGGNDALALALAGRFATQPVVVESFRVRNGPGHNDFAAPVVRTLQPRGPWTFRGRVMLLSGRGVASSNESFVAAMRELPNVTVMGDTTVGATANPKPVDYFQGWKVWVSTWYATLPNGDPIEGRGIPPDVYVPFSASGDRDPVVQAAIDRARSTGAIRLP